MSMNQSKILLEEASVKLCTAVNDIEDLTITKNHKVNILDVLEDLKIVSQLLKEARSKMEQKQSIQ